VALAHLTDLVATFAARVISQYQTKPRFMALHRGLTQLAQDAEDQLWAIVAKLDIDQADGVWLDYLGNFVREPRAGANDADYLKFIKARIVANRSQGRIEDLIAVVKIITALSVFPVARKTPASVEIILDGYAMAEPIRTRLMQLLRATRAAGVRLMVLYAADATDTNMFLFSSDDTLQASATQGAVEDDPNDVNGGKLADADAP
jgi:hypothetical protein